MQIIFYADLHDSKKQMNANREKLAAMSSKMNKYFYFYSLFAVSVENEHKIRISSAIYFFTLYCQINTRQTTAATLVIAVVTS